ncbi:MAG: LTA synthase family protein [Anaerotignum sp.]|nr:LTA synthase family protein [Anaerotignum sp.]
MNPFHDMQMEIYEFFHSSKKTKLAMWIIVALFPLYLTYACNSLAFGSNELMTTLMQKNMGAFLLGAVIVYLIFGALACLTKRIPLAAFLSALFFIIMPLIDYFKVAILETHFFPWDMVFAKNAGSFGTFLTSLKMPDSAWSTIFMTVLYFLLILMMKPELPVAWKKRVFGTPILLVCLYCFCMNPTVRNCYEAFGVSPKAPGNQATNYDSNGFLTAFVLNFASLNMGDPADYNEKYLANYFEKYQPSAESGQDFQNPDIIVVLSEAYWDPTVLNGVTYSEDPLKNYRRIAAEHPSGNMVSCTFGGGTVRPEFEILTGTTTNMLPSGNVPYQQYVFEDIFSYPRLFKNIGYDTLGIHTYQKEFYERDRAYPLLGLTEMRGEYDLHAEHHWNSGPYITDETIAEEVIYQLEQPHETGLFLHVITMENHSMYLNKYDPSDWDIKVSSDVLSDDELNVMHNYCKGVSDSDAALGRIYDYVMNREKPTVVLWYGDHLPTLGDAFSPYITTGNISSTTAAEWTEEEKYTMFSTPYVIFTNYDTGREYRAEGTPVSPYLLPALMCDYIGAPEHTRTNFLLDLYETCPVISPYYDLYSNRDDKTVVNEFIRHHELLTYDDLMGEHYLVRDQLPTE